MPGKSSRLSFWVKRRIPFRFLPVAFVPFVLFMVKDFFRKEILRFVQDDNRIELIMAMNSRFRNPA